MFICLPLGVFCWMLWLDQFLLVCFHFLTFYVHLSPACCLLLGALDKSFCSGCAWICTWCLFVDVLAAWFCNMCTFILFHWSPKWCFLLDHLGVFAFPCQICFAQLHFFFFVFVMLSLLDVLKSVSFRFLYICLPHCVLYCLHDLKTVERKKHNILCAAGLTSLSGVYAGLIYTCITAKYIHLKGLIILSYHQYIPLLQASQ